MLIRVLYRGLNRVGNDVTLGVKVGRMETVTFSLGMEGFGGKTKMGRRGYPTGGNKLESKLLPASPSPQGFFPFSSSGGLGGPLAILTHCGFYGDRSILIASLHKGAKYCLMLASVSKASE